MVPLLVEAGITVDLMLPLDIEVFGIFHAPGVFGIQSLQVLDAPGEFGIHSSLMLPALPSVDGDPGNQFSIPALSEPGFHLILPFRGMDHSSGHAFMTPPSSV